MADVPFQVEASRRASWVESSSGNYHVVDGAIYHANAIPWQREDEQQLPATTITTRHHHPSSTLESPGRGPAVPLPPAARNVTFPLKAHVDIHFPRAPPRLKETVPGNPWAGREPAYHPRGLHAVAAASINDPCGPRDWEEASAREPSSVAQREMPSSRQRGQLGWLDEQRSWLEWAELSLPQDGKSPREEEGEDGEANLDVALSNADQAVPDLDSAPYADDRQPARWGSDPAFTKSKFVPKTDQLSEREVSGIWEEYVATSLKPLANALGSPIPPGQLLIVGNHYADLGFPEVESTSRRISWTPMSESKRPKSIQAPKSEDSTLMPPPTTVARRPPLPPFRGGRKRPMPPRIRPFGSDYT